MKVLVLMGAFVGLLLVSGCTGKESRVPAVLAKYGTQDEADLRQFMDDSDGFWNDVNMLYEASLEGNREAVRLVLLLGCYSDGAIGEGMTEYTESVLSHDPLLARDVVMADERLRSAFGYRFGSLSPPNGTEGR